MRDFFLNYAASFKASFFIHQVLVILALFLLGFLIVSLFFDGKIIRNAIISYPVGLGTFVVLGYILLVTGVPYKSIVVLAAWIVIIIASLLLLNKKGRLKTIFAGDNSKVLSIICLAVLVIAIIATSGLIPISISNDSMYYFHEYPRDIVYYGHLRDQFDTFLTDVGLGAAVIETLPFLFGFNESFGIREFMHINFAVFFMHAVYVQMRKKSDAKKSALVMAIAGLFLLSSSPVWVLGHWAMANMYFMEFFFMASVLVFEECEKNPFPAFIITVACALLRMEGGIFILFFAVCLSMLKIDKKKLACGVVLPILILTTLYSLKIYLQYQIDNPYTFLTPSKSLLQAAVFVAVIIYILLLRDFINKKLSRFLPYVILIGLFMANAVLFVYKRDLYTANLTAFYRNLLGQSGWGMLPHLTVGAVIIIAVVDLQHVAKCKGEKLMIWDFDKSYYTLLTIGFILVTVAVSFMRGDKLDAEIGDSGNRVLLQVAPLVIYTLILYFIRIYERFREED